MRLAKTPLIPILTIALIGLLMGSATASDASMPDLAGQWAMIQFMPEVADLPLVGQTTITAVVCLLVDVEQDGECIVMHDTYCRTEVLSSNLVLTSEVPDEAIESFDPPPRTGRLVACEAGWILEQDWQLEIRGAVLDDPDADELPASQEDERIIDSDGDGYPGFTIPVRALGIIGGDTYVVQRLRYRMIDATVTAERIEGHLEWSSEQNVVGASDGFLMTGFSQHHDPDPEAHRFFMVRLGEHASCADALAVLESTLVAVGGERL